MHPALHHAFDFLIHHGLAVLFGWVLLEQLGVPIPAMPLLLAAGALAGTGRLNFLAALLFAVLAALASDSLWFQLGRHKGIKILQLLCRISLEPDSCVRKTETTFTKLGFRTLLVCKFVPGLNTAAPALAATAGIGLPQFLLADWLGALLWACAFAGLGLAFSHQLDRIAGDVARFGSWTTVLIVLSIVGYIAYKFYQRKRFLKNVAGARIAPQELKAKLDAGDPLTIIDLRHPLDLLPDPRTLPGALQISPEDLEHRHNEITRDGEIVLFCT